MATKGQKFMSYPDTLKREAIRACSTPTETTSSSKPSPDSQQTGHTSWAGRSDANGDRV